MKKSYIIGAAALLWLLSKSKKGNIGYTKPKEQLLYNMIGAAGDLAIEFKDKKLTVKERKALLKEALKFEQSNIDLVYRFNKLKGDVPKFNSSKTAYDYLKTLYPAADVDAKEMIVVLYLNRANKIIAHDLIHIGGIHASIVDARLIIQKALLLLSPGIILSHNHPSGSLAPSRPDLDLTQKLKKALKTVDIDLLDHIIVGDVRSEYGYYSFADEGMLF